MPMPLPSMSAMHGPSDLMATAMYMTITLARPATMQRAVQPRAATATATTATYSAAAQATILSLRASGAARQAA